jgi:chromosome segregation ATPase
MKKILLILGLISFVSCTNPSMERGLESLNSALAELEAAMSEVNVDQMITDISTMQDQIESIENDVQVYEEQVTEWESQIQTILANLESVTALIESSATNDQLQDILDDLEHNQSLIDMLVAVADYDYDGVLNALDQCPDTVLNATVNGQGCSEVQLAEIAAATASSTTTSSTGG